MRANDLVRRHRDLWLALASALTATGVAIVALRAWRLDLHSPIVLEGDATQVIGYVQNMIETGSPSLSPRLGAPFGQQYQDFPLGTDNLNFGVMKLISLVTGDAVATVNVFYFLTFALVAVAAYWALRALGVGRPVCFVAAVVYALVPFHFMRGTGHLFLSAYFAVPLAAYILVSAVSGKPLFGLGRSREGSSKFVRWRPVAAIVVVAAVIASTGAYYAAFALILLVPAAVLGWFRSHSKPMLVSAVLAAAAIVVVVLINALPSFLFWLQNGPNPDVPARGIGETALHQLRPLTMLMPIVDHRFPPFASLARNYLANFPPTGENGESAGFFGAAGLVLLVVVVLGSLVGRFGRRWLWRRERALAALTLVAFIVAGSGAASALMAIVVTPQIRAWGRMSIFIDFFGLLAVSLVLTLVWRFVRPTRWRNVMAVALVAAIGFAALDQTSNAMVPAYEAERATFQATSAFVQQVEASLPAGASIYQLPYRSYPEGGSVGTSADYDPLQPYLYSDALRFSYGGVKGREAGWQLYLSRTPVVNDLPIVCSGGFSAIWLDRAAYEQTEAVAVEAALTSALAASPIVGVSDRYALFDLRTYCAQFHATVGPDTAARLSDEVLRPVYALWQHGARLITVLRASRGERVVRVPGELSLFNAGDSGRQVTVSFTLTSVDPTGSTLGITWPDGSDQTVSLDEAVTKTLVLGAGPNLVEFHAAVDPALVEFVLTDLYAVDPDLLASPAS